MFNFMEIFIPAKGRATAESVVLSEGDACSYRRHLRKKKPDIEKKDVASAQNILKTK